MTIPRTPSVGGSPEHGPPTNGGNGKQDPTRNVLDLVDAAIRRQDDLREMESAHTKELGTLRAEYDEKLRRAETARIDAIRAVDVGQVQRAAEVQSTAAITLASQVSTSAETLRTQVAAAATAAADSLRAAMTPILEAISALQKAQYETQGGKTQVAESREDIGAKRSNTGMWVGIGIAVAGLVVSGTAVLVTVAIFLLTK